jgi:2-phospho-L-lactate guanylyltransferase
MPSRSQDDAGIVIPLRSFTLGKARLAEVLTASERETLVRSMADCVVNAAAARPIAVVSSAPEVLDWVRDRQDVDRDADIDIIEDPGTLDAAADAGRLWAGRRGLARYAVVHADLPLARSLDAVMVDGDLPIAVIVPDHRDDGTPVLSLPTASPFAFAYGPGSAARHADEARRRSLTVRIVSDPALAFDVDVAADLGALEAVRRTPAQ